MRTSVGVSILLAVACTSFGLMPAARAANVFTRLGPAGARVLAATSSATGAAVRAGEDATLLTVDADAIAAFRAAGGGRLSVPDAGGGTVELELEPMQIFGDSGASGTAGDGDVGTSGASGA